MIASGPPHAVRSDPAVIAAYLGDETDDEIIERPASPATRATVAGGAS
jgi:hypothetical protein